MHIRDLKGKHICILGFGREGQATLRALEKYAPGCDVTIADQNGTSLQKLQALSYKLQAGKDYLNNLDRFDVIIKSPGIPPQELLTTHYKLLTNSTQIFLDSIHDTGALVIGVTGSKGKSTTASLIYEILKAGPPLPNPSPAGRGQGEGHVYLIGNIGTPALDFIDKATEGIIFVMEMSSYQLMDLTVSPEIAVIVSFFPEHLDYHGSLKAYREAKMHVTRFQAKDDVVFYPSRKPPPLPSLSPSPSLTAGAASEGEGAYEIAMMSPGKQIPFSEEDAPVKLEETKLIGQHNLRNIAAAWTVAEFLGVPKETVIAAIRSFQGLPHRLQSLGIHHGIEWVDDAISTTPESTIAALEALGGRVRTIILGGQDRGNDFSELGRVIAASPIKNVILFPGSGPRIKRAIKSAKAHVEFFEVESMEEAVRIAGQGTGDREQGIGEPVVLLSTASPSYNMFKNFEEKGLQFQQCISRLTSEDLVQSSLIAHNS